MLASAIARGKGHALDHKLLLISIRCTPDGEPVLTTIWATTSDLRSGHRRTDVETIASHTLPLRLAELVPALLGSSGTLAAAA